VSEPVSAVLFDLDSTLCEHPVSRPAALDAAFRRAGRPPFFTFEDFGREVENSAFGSMLYRNYRIFPDLAAEAGLPREAGRQVAAAYHAERHSGDVIAVPGATAVLDHLRRKHELGLVTNGSPDTQEPKLGTLGLRDRFGTVVYAGFETAFKPDPEPFERTLDRLGVSAERAVYAGDSLRGDVGGAQAAGLEAVWVSDGSDPASSDSCPEYVVDSLDELVSPPWNDTER
jgi:putative hydrolase of the HAD superfamily